MAIDQAIDYLANVQGQLRQRLGLKPQEVTSFNSTEWDDIKARTLDVLGAFLGKKTAASLVNEIETELEKFPITASLYGAPAPFLASSDA